MSEFGLDYSGAVPSLSAMLGANVKVAIRYAGYFSGYDLTKPWLAQGKVLSSGEANMLSQAGIGVVSSYEWYAARPFLDPFMNSYGPGGAFAAGVWDANMLRNITMACGGPSDPVGYAAYDYNTDGSLANEQLYIEGFASVLGLDKTGIYGPYQLCVNFAKWGLAKLFWQTYAWSGGLWFPGASIRQYANGMQLGGVEVDFNTLMVQNVGQWFVGQPSPPPPPVTLEEENMLHIKLVGVGDEDVFAAPSRGTLVASTDFGFADLRFAIYHRNPGTQQPYWEVIPDVRVNSFSNKVLVKTFGAGSMLDAEKVSVRLEQIEPGAIASVEALPEGY